MNWMNEEHQQPYLTIVATTRNDNHGGDLLRRTQFFVEGILHQSRKFKLPVELIIVEWNPPVDRPSLAAAIDWSYSSHYTRVRIIEVPQKIHRNFKHAEALPLFQMIAKNVGIRRAQGEFVLATNIDILFSDELMRFFAQRELRHNRMYRIDRCDADRDVPLDATVEERLHYCQENLIRLERCDGTLDLRTREFHRIYWQPDWRVRLLELLQDSKLVPIVTRQRLHLNACGDFTLMARDRWASVRAYPEFEMYSMHLDSVLCTQAHFDGTREIILRDPQRIYHIEHGAGSGFTPENESKLNDRLEDSGIPQLHHDQFHRWAIQMRRASKPIIFNQENWGLAGIELRATNPITERPAIHPPEVSTEPCAA